MEAYKTIIIFLILGVVMGYLLRLVIEKKGNGMKPGETTIELIEGAEKDSLVVGKPTEHINNKVYRDSAKVGASVMTKTDTLKFGGEDYSLGIIITHKDSIEVDYFLDIKTKTIERIDTVFRTKVNIMKVKEYVQEDIPFYKSFWFGGIVGAIAVILIVIGVK